MRRLSGYVFDSYDDVDGRVLRSIMPSHEGVPDFVKTAARLTSEQVDHLADDNFALVMLDEGSKLKKYAMTDKGNTALSVMYLLKQAHLLPPEAVKTAAHRLLGACAHHGLAPPAQLKLAAATGQSAISEKPQLSFPSGMAENIRLGEEPDDQDLKQRANVNGTPGTNYLQTPIFSHKERQVEDRGGEKTAGVHPGHKWNAASKSWVPASHEEFAAAEKAGPQGYKGPQLMRPMYKTAGAFGDSPGEVRVKQKNWKESPYVDVSRWDPQAHALTDRPPPAQTLLDGQYPVDSMQQVKTATEYFFEHPEMHPMDRRTYCVKLASRMQELGMPVPEKIERYGSPGYAADVDSYLEYRKPLIQPDMAPALDMLIEKRASIEPTIFAEALVEFDKMAGLNWYWGEKVPDPYLSVFGPSLEKIAAADWTYDNRGVRIHERELEHLARNGKALLKRQFGHSFPEEFAKNPKSVFNSLPEPNKLVLARMAMQYDAEQP